MWTWRPAAGVLTLATAAFVAACTSSARMAAPATHGTHAAPTASRSRGVDGTAVSNPVPRWRHVVVVVEENHAYGDVIGNDQAPYVNALARSGALLTRSFGIGHPSEPNYLALFSGSTHDVTDDSCPHSFHTGNLGSQLRSHGLTFAAYSQSLPSAGYLGCSFGAYARKHAPWTNFPALPARLGKPMSAFPARYAGLPTVSFVIPDLVHDMHDGTVAQADRWLRRHLGGYVTWARSHDSLLVLTWDEDDTSSGNRIPGVIAGAHVRPGRYAGRVDHYRLLRTIEAGYGLRPIGHAADRRPILALWTP